MKKICITIFSVILMISMLFTTSVMASDEPVLTINGIEIDLASGNYLTNTTMVITLKAETAVTLENYPTLVIQFGEGPQREITTITDDTLVTELVYEYRIQESDQGELKVLEAKYSDTVKADLSIINLNKEITANVTTPNPPEEDDDPVTEDEWTNFSGANFEWTDYTASSNRIPSLQINNVTFQENHSYWAYITNDIDNPPALETMDENLEDYATIENGVIPSTYIASKLEESGSYYLWIVEQKDQERRVVLEAQQIRYNINIDTDDNGNNDNNNGNNNNDNNNDGNHIITDGTMAGGKIPQTGSNILIGVVAILVVAAIGVYLRIKIKKTDDVK